MRILLPDLEILMIWLAWCKIGQICHGNWLDQYIILGNRGSIRDLTNIGRSLVGLLFGSPGGHHWLENMRLRAYITVTAGAPRAFFNNRSRASSWKISTSESRKLSRFFRHWADYGRTFLSWLTWIGGLGRYRQRIISMCETLQIPFQYTNCRIQ